MHIWRHWRRWSIEELQGLILILLEVIQALEEHKGAFGAVLKWIGALVVHKGFFQLVSAHLVTLGCKCAHWVSIGADLSVCGAKVHILPLLDLH